MTTEKSITRPEFCTDEHLTYLDHLRESGVTNMFGAASFLEETFDDLAGDQPSFHSSRKAKAVLAYWMSTFGQETR